MRFPPPIYLILYGPLSGLMSFRKAPSDDRDPNNTDENVGVRIRLAAGNEPSSRCMITFLMVSQNDDDRSILYCG